MKLKQFKTCPLFFAKTRVKLFVCLLAMLLLSGCKNTPVEPIKKDDPALPEWVQWLAQNWGASAEDWTASAQGTDIELWLRENETYGEGAKCWTIESALQTVNDLSVEEEKQAETEEDWEKVGQDLFEKLAAQLSTPNENRSFCFRDVKNYEVHTEYHEDAKQWTVWGIAEVSYDGIILPTGVTDQNIYLKINFGSFRIDQDGNRYTLHPTGTDHG